MRIPWIIDSCYRRGNRRRPTEKRRPLKYKSLFVVADVDPIICFADDDDKTGFKSQNVFGFCVFLLVFSPPRPRRL